MDPDFIIKIVENLKESEVENFQILCNGLLNY
jgi:hypothetical protein